MSDPDFGNITIVGGRGQMGQLFMERSRKAGYPIRSLDRPLEEQDIPAIMEWTGMLILSIPVTAMDQVLELLVPHMRKGCILMDLGSVKVQPMQCMLRHYSGPVVGTHPLFGPCPGEFTRVAVTPGNRPGDDDAVGVVDRYISDLGFDPFRTTAEEHDRAVGMVQGLNFVTSVAYLATLSHLDNIDNFLTPSFMRRLEAAKKMLTEDAELFATLFEANPFGQEAVKRFRNFLNVAAGGDVDILVDRARWWWRT